jgi:large-conductance mechanosensitive channel
MVIGLQMNAFWGDFTKSIIDPISKKVIHDDINHLNFSLLGMKFYFGKVLISLINIMISFFFLFQLYKLAKSFGLH